MIDHHIHFGQDYKTGFSLDLKTLSKRLDLFNLDGAIIFSCPNKNNNQSNPYQDANQEILEASSKDKRLVPFMFIHPTLDKLGYVEKEKMKFRGFKLYPRAVDIEYDYSSISNRRIMDLIIELSKIEKEKQEETEIKVLEGNEGLRALIKLALKHKTFDSFGSTGAIYFDLYEMPLRAKQVAKLNLGVRIIGNEK